MIRQKINFLQRVWASTRSLTVQLSALNAGKPYKRKMLVSTADTLFVQEIATCALLGFNCVDTMIRPCYNAPIDKRKGELKWEKLRS